MLSDVTVTMSVSVDFSSCTPGADSEMPAVHNLGSSTSMFQFSVTFIRWRNGPTGKFQRHESTGARLPCLASK
jgi:hypothetical protein